MEEILDPSHSALVVWDVQNLLVDKIFNKQEFMNNLISTVELARKSNVPVFFTRIQMLPSQFESPSRLYTLDLLRNYERKSSFEVQNSFATLRVTFYYIALL